MVYKIDVSELNTESVKEAVSFVDSENANREGSLEMMLGKAGPTPNTIITLSKLLGSSCSEPLPNNGGCLMKSSQMPSMDAANNNDMTFKENTVDYNGVRVMTSQDKIDSLDMGFVYKINVSEVNAPLIVQLLILLGTAFGVSFIGVVIIGWSGRTMLKTIEDTWERGKQAVEQEKASFETLVGALYPKFVSEKLLAGEHQIVMELQHVMFFSLPFI